MASESEAILKTVREELEGKIFRGVDDIFAKYFGDHWVSADQNNMLDTKSADAAKLSADLFNIEHLDPLVEWLASFQSLFIAADSGVRLQSKPITTPDSHFSASICMETSDVPTVAGSTLVYGEYHHGKATCDDDDRLRFCARALQVFKAQPIRYFLHAFLLIGTTLELWVFDRSGAYSSEMDLVQEDPCLVLRILAGYSMMSGEKSGINTFVKHLGLGSDGYVVFEQDHKLYLQPGIIAAPSHSHLVGLGTTCIAASESTPSEPSVVVKFSWREDNAPAELQLLELTGQRKVWGVIELLGREDVAKISELREGLQFPQPVVNRTLSCVATSPLGRPIRKFASIRELLEVLGDLVKALQSLYVDGRMLHRDIAIKNLIINPEPSIKGSRGVLIDFDAALDLDKASDVEPLVGSDGFMAIGILLGERHTYRHDLESLFYVFLWLAIANDSEHDHAHEILERLPDDSRLRFEGILGEFSTEFIPLKDLAKELHELLFPMHDGMILTGTEIKSEAVKRLYEKMSKAFYDRAHTFQQ
ncbi:hypothetical protein TrVGV298_006167 [Trichoderma virens]|nr:hypothetical protein TrVGV298_006167 [Trichoderma virens]